MLSRQQPRATQGAGIVTYYVKRGMQIRGPLATFPVLGSRLDLVVAYWAAQMKNTSIITESSAGWGWTLALFILTPCSTHCFPAGGGSLPAPEGLESSSITEEGRVPPHMRGCSLPRSGVGAAGVPTLTCRSLALGVSVSFSISK